MRTSDARRHGAESDAGDSDDGDPPRRTHVVDYPTRVVMPNVFADVVESGLPYRKVLREVQDGYSGVMIDEERLVGLKVRRLRACVRRGALTGRAVPGVFYGGYEGGRRVHAVMPCVRRTQPEKGRKAGVAICDDLLLQCLEAPFPCAIMYAGRV